MLVSLLGAPVAVYLVSLFPLHLCLLWNLRDRTHQQELTCMPTMNYVLFSKQPYEVGIHLIPTA